MENISHLLEAIQSLSAQLFVFRTNIEPLTLLSNVPDELADLINNPLLNELVDSACLAAKDLNEFLKPFLKLIYTFTHKKKSGSSDPMIPYADFTVDIPPIIKSGIPEQIKAEDLLAVQDVLPVKHRKDFSYEGNCPHCGAGNQYLYLNNGRQQYACKVCKKTFTDKVSPRDTSGFYCPYCNCKLSAHHDRKGYVVYICPSRRCSYYKEKKAKKEAGDDLDLITSSKQYRYHYHYREFKFNMDEISSYCEQLPDSVNLARIHVAQHTLDLILTYYINYGLSFRKVCNIMRDVHSIHISHQTVSALLVLLVCNNHVSNE